MGWDERRQTGESGSRLWLTDASPVGQLSYRAASRCPFALHVYHSLSKLQPIPTNPSQFQFHIFTDM